MCVKMGLHMFVEFCRFLQNGTKVYSFLCSSCTPTEEVFRKGNNRTTMTGHHNFHMYLGLVNLGLVNLGCMGLHITFSILLNTPQKSLPFYISLCD